MFKKSFLYFLVIITIVLSKSLKKMRTQKNHHCQDGFKCEQHYCILKNATEAERNATLSQPYYYSYLYTQARKNDQSKSAKEIVVENLETLNDKITDFFSNQNSTQS